MYCQKCGGALSENDLYCPKCGAKTTKNESYSKHPAIKSLLIALGLIGALLFLLVVISILI